MKIDMKFFKFYYRTGGWWVRLFGRGFGVKDLNKHGLTFSERNGIKKHFELGKWSFAWLSNRVGREACAPRPP